MPDSIEFTRDELAGSVTISADEYNALRARIAELERAVESQVAEIADKGEAITVLRERVRSKCDRIDELKLMIVRRDEAAQRPPLGYVTLARHHGAIGTLYTPVGVAWGDRESAEMHLECYRDMAAEDAPDGHILAELREVQS